MDEFIDTLIDANKRCREAFTAMVDQYNAVVEYHAFVDPDLTLNRAISKLHHSYKHVESVSNDMSDLMDLARQLVGPTAAETVPVGPVVDNVPEEHNTAAPEETVDHNTGAPEETVEHNRDLPDLDPNNNA
ncbi:hypothetical protein FCM35_KLT10055 [Carex littledalei]|uniref:Uncharacterized protein n=1 Tax=Carex littledalei TaxID=544730 RepID=A0A833RST1_9POAL|nr:hypothetical protein FCM35_KLT10055 [Carex littledalei]